MMKFILQTINHKIVHDFVFELDRGIDYWKWKGEKVEVLYCELEDLDHLHSPQDYIPQGTIEFVFKFIDLYIEPLGSKYIHPIPAILDNCSDTWLTKNLSEWVNKTSLPEKYNQFYIKSASKFKSSYSGVYSLEEIRKGIPGIPEDDTIQIKLFYEDIKSEYRCFVYRGELLDIKRYEFLDPGDVYIDPDEVRNIMKSIRIKLPAYSFDIMIDQENTCRLLEIHEIFSTGTYGFSDYQNYPWMCIRGFQELKRRVKNHEENL